MSEHNGNVLKYFIEQTNKKLDNLDKQIEDIKSTLSDLTKFKSEMMLSSKIMSAVISTAVGVAISLVMRLI